MTSLPARALRLSCPDEEPPVNGPDGAAHKLSQNSLTHDAALGSKMRLRLVATIAEHFLAAGSGALAENLGGRQVSIGDCAKILFRDKSWAFLERGTWKPGRLPWRG